jgi:hypothetical protein
VASYLLEYLLTTDTYHFEYSPQDDAYGMSPEGTFSNGEMVPDGPWTAFVSPYMVNPYGGIGLTLQLQSGELLELLAHANPPADTESLTFVPFDGRVTLRVEHDSGILRFSSSKDEINWTELKSFSPAVPVIEVGVVLRYDREDIATGGMAGQARLLAGLWENVQEEVWLGEPESPPPQRSFWAAEPEAGVTSTSEPPVHVIVGAQFGDLEFDVGKSVRWVSWFMDDVFVLDVNLGTPRYWIVNWAQTFPEAKHMVTGINYFVVPAEFRKEQWRQYQIAFGTPDNSEWFLFLDAHEGLGVDNRSLPDDYTVDPFKSYLWREIQRAEDAGQPYAILPFYAFLRSDHITNVTYEVAVEDHEPAVTAVSVPYYEPYLGQKRLWNAGELQNASFDWSQIDTPVQWDTRVGTGTPPYPPYLNPTVGRATTPDVALPTDFRVTARVRPIGTMGANSHIISQRAETTTDLAYAFTFTDTGLLNLRISTAGTAISSYTRPRDVADNVDTWVRASRRASGSISFEQSPDGVTWHSLGAPVAGGTPVFNSTAAISIGTRSATAQSDVFPGRIYWAQMETLDAAGVPTGVLWRFDAAEYPGTGTSYVDPRGRTWTLASASAIGAMTPAIPAAPAAKLQVISYAYAHWNLQDIVPPETTVPDLDEANDDGWRMRNLISKVRPIPTLPYGDTWLPPSSDPAGLPGPWAPADINHPDPVDPETGAPVTQPVTPDASLLGVVTPLYDCVFRINMRDGVWYQDNAEGNAQLRWDEELQDWALVES